MTITFNIEGSCRVEGADIFVPPQDIEEAIESTLKSWLEIDANILVTNMEARKDE